MRREEFLSHPKVTRLASWLAENLESEIFHQSYKPLKSKKCFRANSFKEAFENYNWKNSTYEEDQRELKRYAEGLKSIDPNSVLYSAIKILNWGGVDKVIAEVALKAEEGSLINHLEETKVIFSSNFIDLSRISDSFPMNSGWTKIYALYNENFIIYDGRVGAALAKIVSEKFRDEDIPELLRFGSGEGANTKGRRRTIEGFPSLTGPKNKRKEHLKFNIRANWLIQDILDRNPHSYFKKDHGKLQAALFMIGYDITEFRLL